jgi:hypothetical protein
MEQIPSREADTGTASQEIPSIIFILQVRHRVHNSPSIVPILSQPNPFHTPPLPQTIF